jgi:hypothetical protein
MNLYFESLLEPERRRTQFRKYIGDRYSLRSHLFFLYKKRKIEIDQFCEGDGYWFKTRSFSFVSHYESDQIYGVYGRCPFSSDRQNLQEKELHSQAEFHVLLQHHSHSEYST